MKFAIYPPINIARLGNSPTGFFIGAETQGSPGTEISDIGEESPVSAFKDKNFRVKRQAARFRIYEFNDDGSGGRPAILPSGTKVRWSVRLVNKKDAVVRSSGPPTHPTVPAQDPSRTDRVIDSGLREALPSQEVSLQGTYRGTPVYLGEVRLDPNGNLLVLGGRGVSNSLSTPTLPAGAPIGNEVGGGGFYNNRDWHDDTSDGPVTASIEFPDGSSQNAAGAWVIVGPPDFARASQAIVTLYDVIFQTAYSQHWVTPASTPSFARDIQPLIARASSLRWAHADPTWGQISTDWSTLSLPDATTAALRKKTRDAILHAQNAFSQFRIQIWQKEYLDKWVSGGFANDWPAGTPPAGDISPASITRVALDGTAGQGFFPGIEGGIILSDASRSEERR